MSKQIEESIIQQDGKIAIKETITKDIHDDGSCDIYRDITEIDKETGDETQTEHESFHNSGAHNYDFIGSEETTHMHERRSDGSTDVFDENNSKDKSTRDREPYSQEL